VATLRTSGRAGFVFDQYSATDYKWAAIDVVTKQVLIGHRQGDNWVVDAAVARSTLAADTDYTLGVTLRGSTVGVTLDGQVIAAWAYNAIAIDGRFGVFAKGGAVSFDSMTLKTNDAQVPATLNLAAQAEPGGTLASSVAPGAAQVQPLVAEAIRRWSMVEDAALVARLRGIEVRFADLAGGELAQYDDNVITLDVDAGGRGWFVDPTPGSDGEFQGSGATLVARAGSAAADRIDLLSVLAHEMGHAMGFAHSDGGVMAETLTLGERATPERWFAADALQAGVHADDGARSASRVAGRAGAMQGWYIVGVPAAPADAAAQATPPRIDWRAAERREGALVARPRLADASWQADFVNPGTASGRLGPNAALKIEVPVSPRLTPR
jgi:hypothetical protein